MQLLQIQLAEIAGSYMSKEIAMRLLSLCLSIEGKKRKKPHQVADYCGLLRILLIIRNQRQDTSKMDVHEAYQVLLKGIKAKNKI